MVNEPGSTFSAAVPPSVRRLAAISAGRHPQRAVEADLRAVQHVVLADMAHQRGIFGGLAEPRGERHRGGKRAFGLFGKAVEHRRTEQARQDDVDADAVAGEVARDR